MKHFASLTTITLTLLVVAIPGVDAMETKRTDRSSSQTASSLLAVKGKSNLVSIGRNTIEDRFEIVEENQQRSLKLSEDFKAAQQLDGEITLFEF